MITHNERTKDMAIDDTYRTYDEEPTKFHGHDDKVPVTQLRENDKFRHRGKGWVTVTSVEVRRTRVKVEFLDSTGKEGKAFPTMDLQEDVPIVRQEETDEHKLWRLEEELSKLLHASMEHAIEREDKVRREMVRMLESKSNKPMEVVNRCGQDAVEARVVRSAWATVVDMVNREPSKRRHGSVTGEDWTKGDVATVLVWYVGRERNDLLDGLAGGRSRYVTKSLRQAVEDAQDHAHAVTVAGSYSEMSRAFDQAQRILELRADAKKAVDDE